MMELLLARFNAIMKEHMQQMLVEIKADREADREELRKDGCQYKIHARRHEIW
jgi:hypothetical protein